MEINSNDSFDEEFNSNDFTGRQSIFPSRNKIIIFVLILLIILTIIEKILIDIFLYFIPSYFFLIMTWIIIHLLLVRYLVYTCIFPGKNFLIEFYMQRFYGRNRAKCFWNSLEHLKNRTNKVLQSCHNNNMEESELNSSNNLETSKSKVTSRFANIYLRIKEKYGKLNSYETEFLNQLIVLKSCIEHSSLQENSKKYIKKEQINLSKKDHTDYENIKNEANKLQKLLNEFRGDVKFNCNINFMTKYIKNYFFNDILSSKKFARMNVVVKNPNSKELKIMNQDNLEIDCLLIYANNKDNQNNNENQINHEEENYISNNKNLVIVCGPNLTPFESFINSWNLDTLYLSNNTDILFWNYRGYGFSEGSANFTNVCTDIVSIYDYMVENFKYNKIIVHGLSIGGLPSCYLASKRNVDLLIADRTFGSVQDFLDAFRFGSKILYYLAKLLLIPFVNNTQNFMRANCKKILLNDPEDTTIIDNVCLKTSISKKIIYELFNTKNPELNIRNIKSCNIIDYALEPGQAIEIYNSFKYTINFIINNSGYGMNDGEGFLIEKEYNDEKEQKLNENQIIDNIEINDISQDGLQKVRITFYRKIYNLYSIFNSAGDYLIRFFDYMNTPAHFNNFFNNLFIYGTEDLSKLEYCLCNINDVDEMLNNFIQEADNFLNSEEIRRYSDYQIYKYFSFFVECMKNFKIFVSGLHLASLEKDWFCYLKGELIPLNCGHILFYNERELNTLKYLIKESMSQNNINNKEEE